ncbi:MAG: ABC transporter ATP-binding protein, partial [Myxococcota bacterium]
MTELPMWPVDRIEEALYRLGQRHSQMSTFGLIADRIVTPRDIQPWLYAAASREGLEAEPLVISAEFLEDALRTAGPIIVVIYMGALAVKKVRGSKATLLTPDGGETTVPLARVCAAVRWLWGQKLGYLELDTLVERANIPESRHRVVNESLLQLQLASREIEVGWIVRPAAGAPHREQLRYLGQYSILVKIALAFFGVQVATIGAWYLLGLSALTGNLDPGWITGCAVALISAAVLKVVTSFYQGVSSIAIGAMLKKRLLLGALRAEPEVLQHEGLGRTMGRVLESQALEELSLSGGFLCIFALLEFLVAVPILLQADALLFAVMMVAFCIMLWACLVYYRRTRAWTVKRLGLTDELVEHLVGHRTRVSQGDPQRLHDKEDGDVAEYAATSRFLDTFAAAATVLVPRGTLIIGILALAPLFLAEQSATQLWIGVGGVLLAQQALTRLAAGVSSLFEAGVAWQSAAPLLRAAQYPEEPTTEVGLLALGEAPEAGTMLLEIRDVDFRYSVDRAPVLRGVTVAIRAGDHLLLEGASGSGKSTFVGLLAGLRAPSAGLVLLGGLDRPTLGA